MLGFWKCTFRCPMSQKSGFLYFFTKIVLKCLNVCFRCCMDPKLVQLLDLFIQIFSKTYILSHSRYSANYLQNIVTPNVGQNPSPLLLPNVLVLISQKQV